MVTKSITSVFLSHSHHDRDEALKIQRLLRRNGVETFLDQEEILAGSVLPSEIKAGIKRCATFLLLWSDFAATSRWVRREWMIAFELKKRLVPYVLDSTPLPDALENFVHVERTDQNHGNAELFRAVLGKVPVTPVGVDLFPGLWEATLVPPDGSGTVVYSLELRANGQVTGESAQQRSGTLGWAVGMAETQCGLDLSFMFQPTPIAGTWSYTPGTLRLDLVQQAYGQQLPFSVEVHATSKGRGVLRGTGPAGTAVTLRRAKARRKAWR